MMNRARKARAALRMAANHPENPVRRLRRKHERWLDSVCRELWPRNEYTQIVADDWRERHAP